MLLFTYTVCNKLYLVDVSLVRDNRKRINKCKEDPRSY